MANNLIGNVFNIIANHEKKDKKIWKRTVVKLTIGLYLFKFFENTI